MKINLVILGILFVQNTFATPSSTFWSPATASCQAWKVVHVTYDSYFRKGPGMDSDSASAYPTDYGLEMGFLPYEKIQGEIGWDALYPSEDPDLLNVKLCTPESSLFDGSPAISFGIMAVGFKKDVSDYNLLHLVFQKSLPFGGYVAAGGYSGQNKTLFTNSDGKVERSGFLFSIN
jgi:hypothetical protein